MRSRTEHILLVLVILEVLASTSLVRAQSQIYEKASRAYQERDYTRALALELEALKDQGNNAPIRHIYGLTLAELQRFSEAEENLRKAIELRPTDSNFHHGLAYAFCKQKKYDEAIPILKRAIELDGENLKASFLLGLAYVSKERS